jgi:drug/metabolite transporter (DMT)-like permease
MLIVCILRTIFASTYLIGKQSLLLIKPIFLVGSRMSICGILFLAYYIIRQKKITVEKKHIWIFLQIALFKVYIPYVFDTVAAQYVSSHKWALIYTCTPFITAIFSYLILHERFGIMKLWGLAFGLLGFIPILFIANTEEAVSSSMYYIPECLIVISMIAYAYGWIITKKIVHSYDALLINGMSLSVGGALSLLTSFFVESNVLLPSYTIYESCFWILMGILANMSAYQLYVVLLKSYSPTLLSFTGLLDPIFIAFFNWLLFAQQISLYFFYSICLLSFGLYIFYKGEKTPSRMYNS